MANTASHSKGQNARRDAAGVLLLSTFTAPWKLREIVYDEIDAGWIRVTKVLPSKTGMTFGPSSSREPSRGLAR